VARRQCGRLSILYAARGEGLETLPVQPEDGGVQLGGWFQADARREQPLLQLCEPAAGAALLEVLCHGARHVLLVLDQELLHSAAVHDQVLFMRSAWSLAQLG
jgi:hypothetical protein